MKKIPLDKSDFELIGAGQKAFEKKLVHDWHGVTAVVRLRSGKVETAFVVEAEVPALTVCAEPILIGKILELLPEDPIEAIVAVRARNETKHKVIPPCGRCREFITDYAPDANVIIEEGDEIFKVQASDLLPFKYTAAPDA